MKTLRKYLNKQKSGLIILVMTVALLQATGSTPSLKTIGVGTVAPEFSLQDLRGNKKNFARLKGDKLTLLLFWASWSKNSPKALQQMEGLHKKYKERGLSVIAINVEKQTINTETLATIKRMVDSRQLTFPVLVDHGLVTFHDYGVIAVPTTVILDKDRIIMFEMSGLPMVGTEEMIHFLAAQIEGKDAPDSVVQKNSYQPDKKALRSWNMGINVLKSKRMADTAERWFKIAILADPSFISPYLSLGNFYKDEGKRDAAREQFEKAVALKGNNASALASLALLLIEDGSLAEAREMLEKAVKADEAYTPAYCYFAYLTGKEGNIENAEKLFSRAEELNPMDYRINVYRGKMHEEQGRLELAAGSYKNSLKQLLDL